MRILRVTTLGYEAGGDTNGIILVNEELRRRGHEVRTVASDAGPRERIFAEYTFPSMSSLPSYQRLLFRCFYPTAYRAVRDAVADFKPDIIQFHTLADISPSVLFATRGLPAVITIHGAEDFTPSLLLWAFPRSFFKGEGYLKRDLNLMGWFHYLYHRYVNSLVYKLGFRRIRRFIVFSAYMGRLLKKDGFTTTVIPNATRLFEAVPLAIQSRTIAYVGRLEKIKGVQYVIDALPQVRARFPDVRLKIAGVGAYEGELRVLAEERGVANTVEFLGHLGRNDLYTLYQESALSVVPSIWPEPFGKVGIEAMSVGRPVIAADVGGISEWLIDGTTGYLVPAGNSEAIADRVIRLFDNDTLRLDMATAAKRQAQDFSIEEHTDRILALYGEVTRGRG